MAWGISGTEDFERPTSPYPAAGKILPSVACQFHLLVRLLLRRGVVVLEVDADDGGDDESRATAVRYEPRLEMQIVIGGLPPHLLILPDTL